MRDDDLLDQPTFAWWDLHILKERTRLIKLSKHKHKRNLYKFGSRIPRTRDTRYRQGKEKSSMKGFYNKRDECCQSCF